MQFAVIDTIDDNEYTISEERPITMQTKNAVQTASVATDCNVMFTHADYPLICQLSVRRTTRIQSPTDHPSDCPTDSGSETARSRDHAMLKYADDTVVYMKNGGNNAEKPDNFLKSLFALIFFNTVI